MPSHAHPSARRPPVIGLVGGIGAGKSTVAGLLAELGCVVCDSDSLARESFSDPAIIDGLRSRWGERVFAKDGSIDRRRIAAIVFSDAEARAFLEGLTHPWIESRRHRLFAAAPASTKALVIDAPLLLEAGLAAQCDAVLFVDASRDLRLSRVALHRSWDEDELARREAAQWPAERKRAQSTHVILNDGDSASLRRQAGEFLDRVIRDRALRDTPPEAPT
jgi:dephospho-CoA kinase